MTMTASPPPRDTRAHLILGGCGFIGRAVAGRLLAQGARVVVAGRAAPDLRGAMGEAARAGQLRYEPFHLETADWERLIDGIDVIHHYAWSSIPATANEDPVADLACNVVPTLALLDAMRRRGSRAPRLVFSSSGGTVYGRLREVPVPEDHPLQPINAYGASKATTELYMSQYRAVYGLDCRIARLANPFGSGQDVRRGQGAATAFLYRALNGQPIEIWGDGEVMRDYIHISDAAAGLIALASHPLESGPFTFNIGSGKGVSLNGVVAELERRLDRRLAVRRGPSRPFDVPVSILDVALARNVLQWTPKLSFAEGVVRTITELSEAERRPPDTTG